jgi:hypothetical protein
VFKRLVMEASEKYGGEVKVKIAGRALVHISFLDAWLPFSTTRYPLVRDPAPELHILGLDGHWREVYRLPGGGGDRLHSRHGLQPN